MKKKKKRFIVATLITVISHCIILLSLALCRFGAVPSVPLLLAMMPSRQSEDEVTELQFESKYEFDLTSADSSVMAALSPVGLAEFGFGSLGRGTGTEGNRLRGNDHVIDLNHYRPCVLIIYGNNVKQYRVAISRCRQWLSKTDQKRLIRIVSSGGRMDGWVPADALRHHQFYQREFDVLSLDELCSFCEEQELYVGAIFDGKPINKNKDDFGGGRDVSGKRG